MCQGKMAWLFGILLILSGCATPSGYQPQPVEPPVTKSEQVKAQKAGTLPSAKRYKQKIAVIRFTNETNYGKALMTDADFDRLGKQASDMLVSRLVKSGNYLVFERSDMKKIQQEQTVSGGGLIGVDTIIVGSVTEFGRSIAGKTGFLSSTKVQTAKAKVEIRLVDIKTGQAYFSAAGAGEASTESGEIAGYGSRAEYDATLNDRAIGAAITDVIDKLVATLEEKPWRTDILHVENSQVFISGGARQGIRIGDTLKVMAPGQKVKSKQTGMEITLPGKQIAAIKVISIFGDNENNEGSVCEMTSGAIPSAHVANLYVEEVKP
ncbi:MAG TPA: CsgG/HfaB family protein [Smithellaceae bacterium]|jgi:curli biogenesis system outer membrane secretion channel CsgG|nr:CsgG/HfaB family protein [Smithellaceae bacterium]HQM45874.1 CsgG/HfaB family protein [Smithellaceae bacterium]